MKKLILLFFLFTSLQLLSQQPIPAHESPEQTCNDCSDNDGDGRADCADSDCNCKDAIPCLENGAFYQTIGANQLHKYNVATQIYDPVGVPSNIKVNAIGYNLRDGYIYGIQEKTNHLVKIYGNGQFQDIGAVNGLPSPTTINRPNPTGGSLYIAGDFDLMGNMYVYSPGSAPNKLFIIPLCASSTTPFQATSIKLTDSQNGKRKFYFADFVFSNGDLYGMDRNTNTFCRIDLRTLTPTTVGVTVTDLGTPISAQGNLINCQNASNGNSDYGAAFTDVNGAIYLSCNASGDIFRINIPNTNNPIYTAIQTNQAKISSNDGASCALSNGLPVCRDGENLITNGDFEDKNSNKGFISDYQEVASLNGVIPPNNYEVINYDNQICSNWNLPNCDGDFGKQVLVVNGQTQQQTNTSNTIWQTKEYIMVEKETGYLFCFHTKHLEQCCFDIIPKIQVEISYDNSTWQPLIHWTSIADFNPSPCGDDWMQMEEPFLTKSNKLSIRIIIEEEENGDGNDIAIDNICLTSIN